MAEARVSSVQNFSHILQQPVGVAWFRIVPRNLWFKPLSPGSCAYTGVCPTFAQPYSAVGQPPTLRRSDHPGSCPPPWFDGEFHGSNAQADCSSWCAARGPRENHNTKAFRHKWIPLFWLPSQDVAHVICLPLPQIFGVLLPYLLRMNGFEHQSNFFGFTA